MQIIQELELRDFIAWSGAKHTLQTLIDRDDVDELEDFLNGTMEIQEKPWSETRLNDFLWFDTDGIAQILGYDNWEMYELGVKSE